MKEKKKMPERISLFPSKEFDCFGNCAVLSPLDVYESVLAERMDYWEQHETPDGKGVAEMALKETEEICREREKYRRESAERTKEDIVIEKIDFERKHLERELHTEIMDVKAEIRAACIISAIVAIISTIIIVYAHGK